MAALRTDAWGRVRQSFADQFEPRGSEFIYRKSQKGAGFKVTPAERDRFVESFDSHLTRAKWIIGVGVTVVIGIVVSLSTYRNIDPSQSAFFASIGLAMVPYLAYFRWAWGSRFASWRIEYPWPVNVLQRRFNAYDFSASPMGSLQARPSAARLSR